MDLGFGNVNQAVGDVTSKILQEEALKEEQRLNDELDKYDDLLKDDDALDLLRDRRLQQLKQNQKKEAKYKDAGHGTYQDLCTANDDIAKAFFEATKSSERLVVHFYRPTTTTQYSDVYHKTLAHLATQHLETRFVKVNVEASGATDKTNTNQGLHYLVTKLDIQVMPTLLLVKNRKAVHQIRGFDQVPGGPEACLKNPTLLALVLSQYGMLTLKEGQENEMQDELEQMLEEASKGVNTMNINNNKGGGGSSNVRRGYYSNEDDDEE